MIRKLAFVEIVVNDFNRMLEWYKDNLGFTVSQEVNNEDGRWCMLKTDEGDEHLALWQPPKPVICNGSKTAFFIPIFVVSDLLELVRDLRAKGVEITEDIRDRGAYRITTIKDTEKNEIQLVEFTH